MKTFFITLAAIALVLQADGQIRLAVQAGGTLTNAVLKWDESGTKVKQKTINKFGYLFGVFAIVPVTSSLFFQGGLNFGKERYKMDLVSVTPASTFYFMSDEKINFIEIPLDLIYQIPARQGHLYFGAGAVIGHGLSGKYENMTGNSGPGQHPASISTDIKFDGKPAWYENFVHYKPFTLSGNMLAGYQMRSGLFVDIEYKYGLTDMDAAFNFLTYKSLGVKFGYKFGSSKNRF
jgi:hypothetical protein